MLTRLDQLIIDHDIPAIEKFFAEECVAARFGKDQWLQLAVREGLSGAVLRLLHAGAAVDPVEGSTPLGIAVEHGHMIIAQILLAYGANKEQAIARTELINRHVVSRSLQEIRENLDVLESLLCFTVIHFDENNKWHHLLLLDQLLDKLVSHPQKTLIVKELCELACRVFDENLTLLRQLFYKLRSYNYPHIENIGMVEEKEGEVIRVDRAYCFAAAPHLDKLQALALSEDEYYAVFLRAFTEKNYTVLQILQSIIQPMVIFDRIFSAQPLNPTQQAQLIYWLVQTTTDLSNLIVTYSAQPTTALALRDLFSSDKGILFSMVSRGLRRNYPSHKPTQDVISLMNKQDYLSIFSRCLQTRYDIQLNNVTFAEGQNQIVDFDNALSDTQLSQLQVLLSRFNLCIAQKIMVAADSLSITSTKALQLLPNVHWLHGIIQFLTPLDMIKLLQVSRRFKEYVLFVLVNGGMLDAGIAKREYELAQISLFIDTTNQELSQQPYWKYRFSRNEYRCFSLLTTVMTGLTTAFGIYMQQYLDRIDVLQDTVVPESNSTCGALSSYSGADVCMGTGYPHDRYNPIRNIPVCDDICQNLFKIFIVDLCLGITGVISLLGLVYTVVEDMVPKLFIKTERFHPKPLHQFAVIQSAAERMKQVFADTQNNPFILFSPRRDSIAQALTLVEKVRTKKQEEYQSLLAKKPQAPRVAENSDEKKAEVKTAEAVATTARQQKSEVNIDIVGLDDEVTAPLLTTAETNQAKTDADDQQRIARFSKAHK